MTVNLALNGFGRIGRNILRALRDSKRDDVAIVAINDLAPLETLAHLTEFDSVLGRFPAPVKIVGATLDVGLGPMRVTAERAPEVLAWGDVDIVLECTGHHTDPALATGHLGNGSDRVLLSGPPKGELKTVVYGINHTILTASDRIVSNGSCTTNCLAPVAETLHQAFGLERAMMVTVHCYTNSQSLTDTAHDDLYRARWGLVDGAHLHQCCTYNRQCFTAFGGAHHGPCHPRTDT